MKFRTATATRTLLIACSYPVGEKIGLAPVATAAGWHSHRLIALCLMNRGCSIGTGEALRLAIP